MGHFYTNLTLRGATEASVVKAVDAMPRVAGVTATPDGSVVVYDRDSERQDGSAYPFVARLTALLNCTGLYVTNHDDSVLWYRLYRSGQVVDEYDSCPHYFDGPPAPPSGGNVALLCEAFGASAMSGRVNGVLHYDRHATENEGARRYVFEVDRHRDLVDALGLPRITVGFGYTYLARDEWPDGLSPDRIYSLTREPGG